MLNVEQTIISQYGNSPTLTQMVRSIDECIDPRSDIDAFYSFVWNVDTAQGFWLDIWGRIVDIPRELQIPATPNYWGFSEATDAFPFDDEPFFDETAEGVTQSYRLADEAYRKLILAKALANISSTTALSVNRLLTNLFADRGRCYVLDNQDMTLRYVFEFALEPFEFAMLAKLPRPSGVGATILQVPAPTFGFAGAGESLDVGTFITEGVVDATV